MAKTDNPFEGSELTTILVINDLELSKKFYIDVLGATVYREYGGNSIVLEFLNNWILLVTPGGSTKDKPETVFVPPKNKNSVSHSFTIRVKDCNKSYKILKERGAKFITPPINWGTETRCFFNDPDGHLFEISEYNTNLQQE